MIIAFVCTSINVLRFKESSLKFAAVSESKCWAVSCRLLNYGVDIASGVYVPLLLGKVDGIFMCFDTSVIVLCNYMLRYCQD
jgi:hypothetical protein